MGIRERSFEWGKWCNGEMEKLKNKKGVVEELWFEESKIVFIISFLFISYSGYLSLWTSYSKMLLMSENTLVVYISIKQ